MRKYELIITIIYSFNADFVIFLRYVPSLLLRFTDDTFDPELAATIGESCICEYYSSNHTLLTGL